MAGKLITLPLRVWVRSARLIIRAAGGAAGRAVSLAGQTIGVTSSNGGSPSDHRPATAEPGWREESMEQPVAPVDVEHPHDEPERRPDPVDREPVHVSREPELVREVAEPGAEDGAGAHVTVIEPWAGYARMNARDVIERARQAGAAELAAVRLYESRHRSRQTVLAAVDRQLKLSGGGHLA
jgi:hypothetical protein